MVVFEVKYVPLVGRDREVRTDEGLRTRSYSVFQAYLPTQLLKAGSK